MNALRDDVLDWVSQGRLRPDALPAALRLAGVTPGRRDWLRFLDRLALWLGAVFLACAVIFFVAYNWQSLGRYARFALVELPILACLAGAWRFGIERDAGKALLLGVVLLFGALLALVGQTYQTGADTWELFAAWAACALPLVLLARFAALWLFWLALLNVAVVLYYQTFRLLFFILFDPLQVLWALFALDTLAWCAWEFGARGGIAWLQPRWAMRVLAFASGGQVTALMTWAIVDHEARAAATVLVYAAWMAAVWMVYRRQRVDLFVLAGAVLSAIVVTAVFLSKVLLKHDSGAGFLLVSNVVIGMSAAGGIWLRNLAREERT